MLMGDEEPAAADRGHNGESPPSEQPAPDSGGNRDDGNRPKTEVTTEQPTPEKEPQGSFSMPEIRDTPEQATDQPTKAADTDAEQAIPDHGQETSPIDRKMTDEEYRIGYAHILTSAAMYPESMYVDIRNLFDTNMEISEKAGFG